MLLFRLWVLAMLSTAERNAVYITYHLLTIERNLEKKAWRNPISSDKVNKHGPLTCPACGQAEVAQKPTSLSGGSADGESVFLYLCICICVFVHCTCVKYSRRPRGG